MLPAQYAIKHYRQVRTKDIVSTKKCGLTIALTAVFLEKPPTLPDTMDMSSGNEAELAPIRHVPAYRPHLSCSGSCRTSAAPTRAMAKDSIIQYDRVFLKYELPPVHRMTKTSCTRYGTHWSRSVSNVLKPIPRRIIERNLFFS